MSASRPGASAAPAARVATGRYLMHFRGRECGEERWSLDRAGEGIVATSEQTTAPPHPFPSRTALRVTLTREWRVTGLEVHWVVGTREVRSTHHAEGARWRVRIEVQDQVKEQEGDFPDLCEVDYGSHLFAAFILARRDFAVGGEHEFPALRIGPPWMAVHPDRMLYRCLEARPLVTALGVVPAKRYRVSLPERGDEAFDFWADERGVVLESYEGTEPGWPWMKLIELDWK